LPKINYVELSARDLVASQRFYEDVFGMKMTTFGPSYASTVTGVVDLGLQADPAETSKAPLPIIEVEDLNATLEAVIAAGAEIVVPIFSFPGGKRFQFLDPSGNELAAWQPDAQ
jgi:predicted enzyme related to lactoylglutathione lyase